MNENDNKQCSRCDVVKPRSDFYVDRRKASGLYSACKQCHNAREGEARIKRYRDDADFRDQRKRLSRRRRRAQGRGCS